MIAAMLLAVACGGKQEKTETAEVTTVTERLPDDQMVYGLACDGSNDTILILLCDVTQNPDTFDILDASRHQQVFGHARIGDQMAILLAPADSVQDSSVVAHQPSPSTYHPMATMVIDIDKILGSWCYQVRPKLRRHAGTDNEREEDFLKNLPDSVLKRLMQPREYGFQLKNDYQAQPIGLVRQGNTTDDRSPVEYPVLKRYREWRLLNGRLILNELQRDTLGIQQLLSSDTADFVLLRRDSLVLRFNDGEHRYYRKEKVESER